MMTAATFNKAYANYSQGLVHYARHVTGDSAEAEDVAQDAWIEAWKVRDKVEIYGIWSWLKCVVKRLWWHRLNRGGQKREGITVPLDDITDKAYHADQEQVAQIAQIAEAAKDLSSAQAIAVDMALAGYDSGDVARMRDTSMQSATLAMRRAVAALRKKWKLQ